MGKAPRLLGYLASFTSASILYMVWIALESRRPGSPDTVLFDAAFAFFLWLFGGTAAALVLLALPWYLAVVWQDRLHHMGVVYFSLLGAAATFVIGCVTAALSPKPLFVEDQTFREGVMIAVQRQGVCLLFTGLVFGLTFWFVSERRRPANSTTDS